LLHAGCLVEPLENRGSYFPFAITIFRSKDPEPFIIELAADDQKTRKQCVAVIKVASTLTRSVMELSTRELVVFVTFFIRMMNLEKRNL
jgi:hypothetical protein